MASWNLRNIAAPLSSRLVLGVALIAGAASVGLTQTPREFPLGEATPSQSLQAISPESVSSGAAAATNPGVQGVPEDLSRGGSEAVATTSLLPSSSAPQIQLGAAGEMIGFSNSDGSGTQTITLVNTRKSWMAVYHVERSGKIRLVSSRPLEADFSLQLNATSPLPEEIRALSNR